MVHETSAIPCNARQPAIKTMSDRALPLLQHPNTIHTRFFNISYNSFILLILQLICNCIFFFFIQNQIPPSSPDANPETFPKPFCFFCSASVCAVPPSSFPLRLCQTFLGRHYLIPVVNVTERTFDKTALFFFLMTSYNIVPVCSLNCDVVSRSIDFLSSSSVGWHWSDCFRQVYSSAP